MSKVSYTCSEEFTFGSFQLEILLMKPLKNSLKTISMILKCVREYYDIVEIDKAVSQTEVTHGSFHQPLKCCWCIAEAKRHPITLKEAKISDLECRFMFVLFFELRLPVAGL